MRKVIFYYILKVYVFKVSVATVHVPTTRDSFPAILLAITSSDIMKILKVNLC